MNQELAFKAAFLERRSQELNEEIDKLSSQLLEMSEFSSQLSFLEKSSQNESLASLGKGVYIKTNLENRDLFVNVGAGIIIKKSIPDTQKIIHNQIRTLNEARIQLTAQIELCNHALKQAIGEMENEESKENKEDSKHVHSSNCQHNH